MTVDKFLLRAEFTLDQPPQVHPDRWGGMLRWYLSRLLYEDKVTLDAEEAEEYADYWAYRDELEDRRKAYSYYND